MFCPKCGKSLRPAPSAFKSSRWMIKSGTLNAINYTYITAPAWINGWYRRISVLFAMESAWRISELCAAAGICCHAPPPPPGKQKITLDAGWNQSKPSLQSPWNQTVQTKLMHSGQRLSQSSWLFVWWSSSAMVSCSRIRRQQYMYDYKTTNFYSLCNLRAGYHFLRASVKS